MTRRGGAPGEEISSEHDEERLLSSFEVDDSGEDPHAENDSPAERPMSPKPFVWGAKMKELGICCAVGLVLWFIPKPEGVTSKAWHLFALFVATITGVALTPLPLGATALLGLGVAMLTGTLTFAEAFSAFDSEVPWLICMAFWLSSGFIKSGLGKRLAYTLVTIFGKTTLGLTYSMVVAEAVVSPAIPSTGARNGGLFIPLAKSLLAAVGSDKGNSTEKRMGSFLMLACFHGSCISSAMFSTSCASNAIAVKLAADAGIDISWGTWALAGIVPGLTCLLLMPLLIYAMHPPGVTSTPDAPHKAKAELTRMGPMSRDEIITVAAFSTTVSLWIFGPLVGVNTVGAAILGLAIMLLCSIISWEDCLNNNQSWDTLTWFAALIAMASTLNKEGFMPWFADQVVTGVKALELSWQAAFLIVILVYFYSHYLFASIGAHIGAMYGAFLAVAISCGAPAAPAAIALAQLSDLMGCLTVYGIASGPPYFNCGYVAQSTWVAIGGILSVFYIVVWLGLGGVWWKVVGIFDIPVNTTSHMM